MVARGILEVKVAVPVDANDKPISETVIFHEKAGIIEDKAGHRIAFNGCINETAHGWQHNWQSFHAYCDWAGMVEHVEDEETGFARLWAKQAPGLKILSVQQAVQANLLRFHPKDGALPVRLADAQLPPDSIGGPKKPEPKQLQPEPEDQRPLVWSIIRHAPALPGSGDGIGVATSAVDPWPHQVRAFHRMYDNWPCKLLIADEVGLGKTIEAGMLLRQAVLSGRAKRLLIIAPKAVLTQWQLELREKFNLNWPIYDGDALKWYPSRPLVEATKTERRVSRKDWHAEPFVLVSSHLMRRTERQPELLEDATPWDLIVIDEAHHARRKDAGGTTDKGPNLMLQLLRGLKARTAAMVLMTATPMQIHPIEVWDLLDLPGMPKDWDPGTFERFFDLLAMPVPSDPDLDWLAQRFQSAEAQFGQLAGPVVERLTAGTSTLRVRRVLAALRNQIKIPRHQLSAEDRELAKACLKAGSPVAQLISRHTRELLREYFKAGKITSRIADRNVEDVFVQMSSAERDLFEAVEDYISTTYNSAAAKERNAVGFVMTIYRRRVASSFAALRATLHDRLAKTLNPDLEEDATDDGTQDEQMDGADAARLVAAGQQAEELGDIEQLLAMVKALPPDTKAQDCLHALRRLLGAGYDQAIVFTQFTDTLDFLRDYLVEQGISVMCYSGRGGEVRGPDGRWQRKSRDDAKRMFKKKHAQVLVCTDAAAEGLNFQFCGALINYDMPWNPMRVEQRIGRIDRLGQEHATIHIINLHYADTVETEVYVALRQRIQLFGSFVGKLQPILAQLPRTIAELSLSPDKDRKRKSADAVQDLSGEIDRVQQRGFDLDAITAADLVEPAHPKPGYDLADLATLLGASALLPPGYTAKRVGPAEYTLRIPGHHQPVRLATSREFYEDQAESCELWSPGSPLFPEADKLATVAPGQRGLATLRDVVQRA